MQKPEEYRQRAIEEVREYLGLECIYDVSEWAGVNATRNSVKYAVDQRAKLLAAEDLIRRLAEGMTELLDKCAGELMFTERLPLSKIS